MLHITRSVDHVNHPALLALVGSTGVTIRDELVNALLVQRLGCGRPLLAPDRPVRNPPFHGHWSRGGEGIGPSVYLVYLFCSVCSVYLVCSVYSVCLVYLVRLVYLVCLVCFVYAPFSRTFGLRGSIALSLGRPQLRFGREGFPKVAVLENQSASALPAPSGARQAGKPLRETPPPPDHPLSCSSHRASIHDGRAKEALAQVLAREGGRRGQSASMCATRGETPRSPTARG
jgi:hypothetical protein